MPHSPLSSQFGTNKTFKSICWPWLAPIFRQKSLNPVFALSSLGSLGLRQLSERGESNSKGLEGDMSPPSHSVLQNLLEPRLESGRDCLIGAEFARQRQARQHLLPTMTDLISPNYMAQRMGGSVECQGRVEPLISLPLSLSLLSLSPLSLSPLQLKRGGTSSQCSPGMGVPLMSFAAYFGVEG